MKEIMEDDRTEPKKQMLEAYPPLSSMYNENDGNALIFFTLKM